MIDYKKRRKELHLTQYDVCRACGLSLNGYIKIEQGITKNPKPAVMKALKKVLKLDE